MESPSFGEARVKVTMNAYTVFVGELLDKRPFGRKEKRWKDDIPTDLRRLGG
jgi:hypothetical protein